jgi:Type II secretion system (T2SS), protein N
MPASRSRHRDTKPQPQPLPPRRPRPKGRWLLLLIGILVLTAATVFVLPASMITRFLPAQVQAEDLSGSLVHGAAGKLKVNARDAGAVEWQVHPLSLLRLAIVADIHWVKVGFVIDGTVELGGRGAAAHDIKGGGPIEDLRDLGMGVGWTGGAHLTFAEVKSDFRKLDSAVGKVEVSNLSTADIAEGSDLGGYVLQLAPGAISPDGTITASLNDTGGPLEAQAQIRFSPATRIGMLSGTLKERPEASLSLRNQLNSLSQLRPRDATGRFPVELEFTF